MTEPIYNGVSISEQEEACRRLAETQGYTVRPENVWREPGAGDDPARPDTSPTES